MAAAIADEIPGAQLLILKGGRHMALAEDPAAIYQPLRAFFRQVFNGDDGDSTSGRL
jgi:pimeloyl-ACP methyl ester carboxylesterase